MNNPLPNQVQTSTNQSIPTNKTVGVQSSSSLPQPKSKIASIFLVLFIVTLGVSIWLGYQYYLSLNQQSNPAVQNMADAPVATPTTPTTALDITSNTNKTKTYSNDEFGVSFNYPNQWYIMEDSRRGAPIPVIKTTLLFLKRNSSSEVFSPSLFCMKLYQGGIIQAEKEYFSSFLKTLEPGYFAAIERDNDSFVTKSEVKLGDKTATRLDDYAGMSYGNTTIAWLSESSAIFIGSLQDCGKANQEVFEELGEPPYIDNSTINNILSSFKILD
jgi:hypothetical protein